MLHGKHHEPTEPAVSYETWGAWVVPWCFGTVEAEYAALTQGLGLLDWSSSALLEVRGHDRAAFLHTLLTQDIRRLEVGRGCPAALLTPNGKLVAECLVLADAQALWLLVDAEQARTLLDALERYHFTEQVELLNHERTWVAIALQGGSVWRHLPDLLGCQPAIEHPGDHLLTSLDGTPIRLLHHRLAAAPGVVCLCPAERALAVWRLLRRRGAAFGLTLVGWEALNIARIEAGVPWFGRDMDETTLLPETGLVASRCSETKGCYVGQEIIARMATYGSPSKRLMGLLVEGEAVPISGDQLRHDGEEAGWITSPCWSPALKQPIALGYVKRGAYEPGTRVEILRGERRLPARVSERPLVRPRAG